MAGCTTAVDWNSGVSCMPFGVRPFAGGSTGVQMAGWFNRELKSAEDLKGLKMRIPGLAGEVFTASGGTSVRLAGGEIYTLCKRVSSTLSNG